MNVFKKYENYKTMMSEKKDIFNFLENMDNNKISNNFLSKIESVVMILPDIYPNLGGITSALRILASFQKHGCQVTVALNSNMNIETAKKHARECIPTFRGIVKKIDDCIADSYDICIATNWESAYAANKLSGYKVYFVQDYEPTFHPTDDFSLLAKNSYRLGYHIISLGKWNIEQIKKNIPDTVSKLDFVDFPYDRNEYYYQTRDYLAYKNKKEINIACYIKYTGRRIPYISEYILTKTKEMLEKRGYKVNIYYFGINKHIFFENGINLGKLTRQDLADLYIKMDFGMVASMSNISLVPYEMLASGLPVIEFKDGSYPYFLGEDTALLTDFNYKTLCTQILDVLQNPSKLVAMHERAKEKLAKFSWDETCNQFWNILQKTISEKNVDEE